VPPRVGSTYEVGLPVRSVAKWKLAPFARLVVIVTFIVLPFELKAQSAGESPEQASLIPEAPQSQQLPTPVAASVSQTVGTADVSGTILDTSDAVVQGATVTISGATLKRSVQSGAEGQFDFASLPAGTYTVTAAGTGMSTYTSQPVELKSGQFLILPVIKLNVSGGTTSIVVSGDKEQLAEEQVRIAEQQRVGGVIPNFYSAYEWNAPPMLAKQKFKLSFRSLIDPVSLVTVAGIAGAEQYKGLFPGYGSGIEGYGKRFGAAYANRFAGDMLSRAVFPSIFHQDPRYFYKGKGSIRSRALYAMSRAIVTRSDDGRLRPNYSEVLGDFSAGAISNLYYPQSDRGFSLVMLNGATGVGANAISNLIREFLLKGLTSHVPKGADGQP
jgi:hypothetical protein